MVNAARNLGSIAAAAMLLAACSGSQLAGTYRADFASSTVPDVALAGELQALSIDFQGETAVLEMSALGNSKRVRVEAHYEDGTVVLEQPRQWVLAIRDQDTLECLQCPAGMPHVWRKVESR